MLLWRLRRELDAHAGDAWCPVLVVMSATIDPDEFARYLSAPDSQVLVAAGRAFPIT